MVGFKTKEREKRTKHMGYEQCGESSPAPKLSLCSLPSKLHESPGMATPPIHTMASVPFQWEEAPGKPRPCGDDITQLKPRTARCLELPPRMSNEPRVADMPSPTTVLDGPDNVGRSMSGSSSSGKGMSFDSPENPGRKLNRDRAMLGSGRWGSLKKRNKGFVDASDGDGVSSGGTTVKITRIRRRSSFMNFSPAGSHLLTSIYEGFKQAVIPWRRRQEKLRKKSQ